MSFATVKLHHRNSRAPIDSRNAFAPQGSTAGRKKIAFSQEVENWTYVIGHYAFTAAKLRPPPHSHTTHFRVLWTGSVPPDARLTFPFTPKGGVRSRLADGGCRPSVWDAPPCSANSCCPVKKVQGGVSPSFDTPPLNTHSQAVLKAWWLPGKQHSRHTPRGACLECSFPKP